MRARFPFLPYTVKMGNERQRAGNGEETNPYLLRVNRETGGKREGNEWKRSSSFLGLFVSIVFRHSPVPVSA